MLEELGFHRRNARQHIWANERLGLVVQVPASFLPAHSSTDRVQTPTGSVISIWSLTISRWTARPGRVLERARAPRSGRYSSRRCGDDFDIERARERAHDDSPAAVAVFDAFLRFYDSLPTTGTADHEA